MSPPTRPARVLAFGHAGTVGTRFGLVASSNSFFRNFLISTPAVERQDARWLSVDDAPFL
ncbi:hypothetical protein, partial [Stenotrophomonas sepilia]|uniref:hypothetical protein n=1 Tax=Stenotrophomonas sepilia TaxID=2860290 RepID=UPI003EE72450